MTNHVKWAIFIFLCLILALSTWTYTSNRAEEAQKALGELQTLAYLAQTQRYWADAHGKPSEVADYQHALSRLDDCRKKAHSLGAGDDEIRISEEKGKIGGHAEASRLERVFER